jgi:uncharacterized protein
MRCSSSAGSVVDFIRTYLERDIPMFGLRIPVETLLLRRLRPYQVNVGKRRVKAPKVYLRETLSDLLGHPVIGASWEGYVVEEICNALPWSTTPFFYRPAVEAEIDWFLGSAAI